MKRLLLILLASAAAVCTASAQQTIEEVLFRVERASKELEAHRRLTDAQKLDARTENNLYDPSVEYEHLWGRGENRGGALGELTVSQSFDFPSAYGNRSKIVRLKGQLYEREGEAFRRELLLEAKSVCLEIIWLRQKEALLTRQATNTRSLHERYRQSLEAGECNILDFNKISIERLASETDLKMARTELAAKQQQLANLTAGEVGAFDPDQYPPLPALPDFALLEHLHTEGSPELRSLETGREITRRTVALNRSLSLPRFEVGYRQNFGMEGKAIGFLAGLSIPMFENRNKVKAAKAHHFFAQAQAESARLKMQTQLRQLYEQAVTLRRSADELQELLGRLNNLEILQKALNAGQITIIEYYNEESILFQTYEQLLEMERDYQLAMARLFSFEL